MNKDQQKDHYTMTPEVREHLELYWGEFDKWNNDEPYKPSILFGLQEKIFEFASRYIDNDMDSDEVMKYILSITGAIAALILILALIFI